MTPRTRKHFALVAIVLLFAAPLATAWLLHALGWQPRATRNFGTLLEPAQDLKTTRLELQDGSRFAWKNPPDWQWTLLGLPGPHCAHRCLDKLDELRRERLTLNQNADRLRVLVVDKDLPRAALDNLQPLQLARDPSGGLDRLRAPDTDQVAAALVDPNGFLILRYGEGYDGSGLRKDLARVVK
ncbi:MAG: hypothetical protein WBV61_05945 [Rhodanobacteraceae bacterium]